MNHKRIYIGKPENKLDPNAIQGPIPKKKGPPPRKTFAKTLPPPTHLDASAHLPKDLNNGPSPMSEAIFADRTDLYEVNPRREFTPQLCGFNSTVRAMYEQYAVGSTDLNKSMSIGMLAYYQSVCTWLRVISLKKASNSPLTRQEQDIIDVFGSQPLTIPAPMDIFIKNLGVITTPTQETLFPTFPNFPSLANGHSLWNQVINLNSHARFEDLPTVGITAETVCNEADPAAAVGAWTPTVVPVNTTPTGNLLGYFPKQHIRQEVMNILSTNGVAANNIRPTIPGTDINVPLILAVSGIIRRLGVFQTQDVVFNHLEPQGSQCQLIRTIPTPVANIPGMDSVVQPFDYTRDTAGAVGMAITYGYSYQKEGAIPLDLYTSWCCIANNAAVAPTVTAAWHANRNVHRNVPEQYNADVFTSGARNSQSFRTCVFSNMVK